MVIFHGYVKQPEGNQEKYLQDLSSKHGDSTFNHPSNMWDSLPNIGVSRVSQQKITNLGS